MLVKSQFLSRSYSPDDHSLCCSDRIITGSNRQIGTGLAIPMVSIGRSFQTTGGCVPEKSKKREKERKERKVF